MKKALFGLIAVCFLTTTFTVVSAKTNGQPFKDIWEYAKYLEQQIENIQLTPGPQGPQGEVGSMGSVGPAGKDGQDAQQGAGNIIFMHDDDYFLKTDGTVWQANPYPGPKFSQVTGPIAQLPVPVNQIVDWEYYSLIDSDGNYWRFCTNVCFGNDQSWYNYGPLE